MERTDRSSVHRWGLVARRLRVVHHQILCRQLLVRLARFFSQCNECGGTAGVRSGLVDQQRKEPTAHRLTAGDWWHAGLEWFIAGAGDAVTKSVNYGRTPWPRCAVCVAAVHHERMMERTLSGRHFNGSRMLKLLPLLVAEDRGMESMSPAKPVTGNNGQRWLPGMYCRHPFSLVVLSSPIQQVRCAMGLVRVQYE